MIQKYLHTKLSDDIGTLPMNTHLDQSTRYRYHRNQLCTSTGKIPQCCCKLRLYHRAHFRIRPYRSSTFRSHNPSAHWQLKEPWVFMQRPFELHLDFPSLHSSMSKKYWGKSFILKVQTLVNSWHKASSRITCKSRVCWNIIPYFDRWQTLEPWKANAFDLVTVPFFALDLVTDMWKSHAPASFVLNTDHLWGKIW